jgi:hypothetical protein
MQCYECARAGVERAAAGLCRYCLVGLCPAHLAEVAIPQYPVPAYTCQHWTTLPAPKASRPAGPH